MTPHLSAEVLRKRVEGITKSPNFLTMVIRGHFIVEQLLNRAIEKYSRAQSNELERLPFALKTELAMALGILPKESHPLFKAFNSLRNRFAHNPFAAFTTKDACPASTILSCQRQLS